MRLFANIPHLLEAFWVLLGQVGSALGSLLLLSILTRNLPVETFGQLSLTLTILPFFYIIVFEGLVRGLGRFYPIQAAQTDTSFNTVTWMTFATATGFSVVLATAFLPLIWLTGIDMSFPEFVLFFAISILNALSSLLGTLLNAARHRIPFSVGKLTDPLIKSLLATIFISTGTATVMTVGWVFLAAAALLNLFYFVCYKAYAFLPSKTKVFDVRSALKNSLLIQLLRYSWPFYTWGLLNWLRTASDKWALAVVGDASDVGLYTASFQLAYSPTIAFTIVIVNFLAPIANELSGDRSNSKEVVRAANLVLLSAIWTGVMIIVLTLAFWIFRIHIGSLVLGPAYSQIYDLLPFIFLAGGLMAMASGIEVQLLTKLNTSSLILPKSLLYLSAVILNFIGAYFFSILGVVIAMFCYSVLHASWAFARLKADLQQK